VRVILGRSAGVPAADMTRNRSLGDKQFRTPRRRQ
jgi:hypothetical protein